MVAKAAQKINSRRARLAVSNALLCFFFASFAEAADVLETDVTHNDGRYKVHFDVRLDVPRERLKRHLTDYANYAKHFKTIRESTVLARAPTGGTRLRLQMYSCVLFFCRTLTTVKDITERSDGTIVAHFDAAQSDFREGTEQWRLLAEGRQTRLQYDAQLVPAFYVPPVIGPWLLKRKIRELLETSAVKFEALAHD